MATGSTVEIIAVISAMPSMHATDTIPNTNRLMLSPTSLMIIELRRVHSPNAPAADSAKQISAIMPASDRNILNTSVVRAPIARSMPISFFLADMDAEMKLNISRNANSANTAPAIKNTVSRRSAVSIIVLSWNMIAFSISSWESSFARLLVRSSSSLISADELSYGMNILYRRASSGSS